MITSLLIIRDSPYCLTDAKNGRRREFLVSLWDYSWSIADDPAFRLVLMTGESHNANGTITTPLCAPISYRRHREEIDTICYQLCAYVPCGNYPEQFWFNLLAAPPRCLVVWVPCCHKPDSLSTKPADCNCLKFLTICIIVGMWTLALCNSLSSKPWSAKSPGLMLNQIGAGLKLLCEQSVARLSESSPHFQSLLELAAVVAFYRCCNRRFSDYQRLMRRSIRLEPALTIISNSILAISPHS